MAQIQRGTARNPATTLNALNKIEQAANAGIITEDDADYMLAYMGA